MTDATATLTPEEQTQAKQDQMSNLLQSGMMGKLITPKIQAAIHTSFNSATVAFMLQFLARKDPAFADHALAFFDTWVRDIMVKAEGVAPTLFNNQAQTAGVFTEETMKQLIEQYVQAHKDAAQAIVGQHAALLK